MGLHSYKSILSKVCSQSNFSLKHQYDYVEQTTSSGLLS